MDDYSDPDYSALSHSDSPDDSTFDPFVPRLREERATPTDPHGLTDGGYGSHDPSAEHDDTENVIRYGRFSNEGDGLDKSDDDRPLPWEGAGTATVIGAAERAEREAAATGDRNVRRAAATHGGDTDAGATGNAKVDSAGVDSSIDAAGERIRAELAGPVDTRQRSAAIAAWDAAGRKQSKVHGPRRQYQKQGVTLPPQFSNTTFEAQLMGLKANASGDWILTLKIDQDAGQLVFPLHSAFGLALDVNIDRHVNRREDGLSS